MKNLKNFCDAKHTVINGGEFKWISIFFFLASLGSKTPKKIVPIEIDIGIPIGNTVR